MKELKAKEGFYLTYKNKENFYKAIKGMNVKEEDYIDISIEEANEIIKSRESSNKSDDTQNIQNVLN